MSRSYPPVPPGTHSSDYFEPNRGTHLRHPKHPRIVVPQTLSELTGPVYPYLFIGQPETDLTRQHSGQPIGERIVVSGSVLDEDGRPVTKTLVEIWQANAAGRYRHQVDLHDAPLDPNFTGCGRTLTDAEGRYRFVTIMPGAYPWRNHHNAWRPAHIHFSVFGPAFCTRLVTQMYFPGDPLLPYDPMYLSIPSDEARSRLISVLDWETTIPDTAVGYRFDIVLRGRERTPADPKSAGGPA